MHERRQFVRVFIGGWEIRIVSGPLKASLGKLIEISSGGLRMQCERALSPGEKLDFELIFPSGEKFSCIGEIVYKKETRDFSNIWVYGVKFDKVSPELNHEIETYIGDKLRP